MSGLRKRNGFTLVEILLTIGIIAMLGAIIFPVFAAARDSARVCHCLSNLQQISLAAKVYYQEQGGPPMTRLPVALGPYVNSKAVFICPDDPHQEDSYSAFFVGHPQFPDGREFLVGCPRHSHGNKGATASGQGKSNVGMAGAITWATGKNKKEKVESISPGQVVEAGTLTFADGSTVTVDKKLSVVVLSSVTEDSVLHTVVYVRPGDDKGEVTVAVTKGANFEVISPEICAAVRGTKFTVQVEKKPGKSSTLVAVSEGQVDIKSRTRKVKYPLKAGHWGYEERALPNAASGPWDDDD